jgi:hypothetical protein
MLTAAQLAQLKTEILEDPEGLGLGPLAALGADADIAAALNQARAEIEIPRGIVASYEVFEAIVPTEWTALNADSKQRVQSILAMSQINTAGPNTQAAFLAAFAGGTTTRANLIALTKRQGSRAEQLFGAGVSISWDDVAAARRL